MVTQPLWMLWIVYFLKIVSCMLYIYIYFTTLNNFKQKTQHKCYDELYIHYVGQSGKLNWLRGITDPGLIPGKSQKGGVA